MARITWHEHADLLLRGELDETLRRWQAEDGLTIDQMARRLDEKHGIEVSRETVRRWLNDLDPQPSERAS